MRSPYSPLHLTGTRPGRRNFFPPSSIIYLFICLILLYFHGTFRLQLPKVFDLPRCLLTRKKTPALSAGSSAHTWAPWRASMLLPNLVTQRARGGGPAGDERGRRRDIKGAAAPPHCRPSLYRGRRRQTRFARESVLCSPAPLFAPGRVVIGTPLPLSPRSAPLKLHGARPAAPSAGAQPASGPVCPLRSPPRPEPGQAGLTVGEC